MLPIGTTYSHNTAFVHLRLASSFNPSIFISALKVFHDSVFLQGIHYHFEICTLQYLFQVVQSHVYPMICDSPLLIVIRTDALGPVPCAYLCLPLLKHAEGLQLRHVLCEVKFLQLNVPRGRIFLDNLNITMKMPV